MSYLNHCRIVQGTYGRAPTSKLSKLSGLGEDTLAATEQGPAGWGPDGAMVTQVAEWFLDWNMFLYWEPTKQNAMEWTSPLLFTWFAEKNLSYVPWVLQWLESTPGQRGKSNLSSTHFSINDMNSREECAHIRYFSPMPSPPGSTHPWPGEGVQIQSSDVGASLPKSLLGEPGRNPQVEGLPHYSCWQMDVLNVPHPIRIKHPPHVPSFAERWAARNPARKWLACRQRRRKNVPRRCQPQMRTDGLRGLRVKVHGIQLFHDHTNELTSTIASFVALQLLEYPNLPSTATFRAI